MRKGTVPVLFPTDRFHRVFKIICIQTKAEELNKSGINEGKYRRMIQNAVCWFENMYSEHNEKYAIGSVRSTAHGDYI